MRSRMNAKNVVCVCVCVCVRLGGRLFSWQLNQTEIVKKQFLWSVRRNKIKIKLHRYEFHKMQFIRMLNKNSFKIVHNSVDWEPKQNKNKIKWTLFSEMLEKKLLLRVRQQQQKKRMKMHFQCIWTAREWIEIKAQNIYYQSVFHFFHPPNVALLTAQLSSVN